MTPEGAHYDHDSCEQCQFKGQMGPEDIWYCPRTDTLMRRWSSEPSEYLSTTPALIGLMAATHGDSHMWGVAGMMAGVWLYPAERARQP